jgi:hypothetical protein
VQRDTYTDTPLPPDEPAAPNPPDGAPLDYYLPSAASKVTIEILDAQGHVVRTFSSADKPEATEEELQKQLIPLYWPRKFHALSTEAGMHRWVWDLHYTAPTSTRHDYPISAIPHDTPRMPLGPNALPGNYKIRLTVDGKSFTSSLTVKMDPRVKTSLAGLQKKFAAETQLASLTSRTSEAVLQAASIRAQLDKLKTQGDTKEAIEGFDKKLNALVGASGGFFAPPSAEATISRVNGEAGTLYQQVWQADAEPTSSQLHAMEATEHSSTGVLKRWSDFKSADLPALNRILHAAQIPEIKPEMDSNYEESSVDED